MTELSKAFDTLRQGVTEHEDEHPGWPDIQRLALAGLLVVESVALSLERIADAQQKLANPPAMNAYPSVDVRDRPLF